MKLADFDYEFPKDLIAHTPSAVRDHSRLMVVDRRSGRIIHDRFYTLPKYLKQDDLLVLNDTKVMPARLRGRKESGGRAEVLLLREREGIWEFAGRNIGRAKRVVFDGGLEGEIAAPGRIKFNVNDDEFTQLIKKIGYTPLPPYIKPEGGCFEPKMKRSYQTIYARHLGSAAAPTAGLHFTPELLEKIPNKLFVTLHVGLGTFAPVRADNIEEHKMHSEWYRMEDAQLQKLKDAKKTGKRIVAVGTTSVRVLETWASTGKAEGETDIFIYPGYKFRLVDAMITNFHLPKSTLLMLVCAFAGRELVMRAYREAMEKGYRFYSFGDAMLVE